MPAKILALVYPGHECIFPQRLASARVMEASACPRCQAHATKKTATVRASRLRGHRRRMFVE